MKNFLKKDIFLKILSLLIAIIAWTYIMDIQDPERTVTLKELWITFINTEHLDTDGIKIIEKSSQTVDLKLKGRRKLLTSLYDTNITVTADMSNIKSEGKYPVPVLVNLMDGITIVEKKPSDVLVTLDKIIEIEKKIRVDTKGAVKDGYVATEPRVQPETVTLKGPSAVINSVDTIQVLIELTGQTKDITSKQKYKIYTKTGEEITNKNIEASIDTVEITYPILKLKTVPVQLNIVGENTVLTPTPSASSGQNGQNEQDNRNGQNGQDIQNSQNSQTKDAQFIVVQRQTTPDTISIAGTDEELSSISSIVTTPIYLDAEKNEIPFETPIIIPENVRLISPQQPSVSVKLKLEEKKQNVE